MGLLSRRQLVSGVGALLGLSPLGFAARAEAAERGPVVLVPFGSISALEVDVVARALPALYAVRVAALAPRALPRRAFYAPRGRYRAERLLEELEPIEPPAFRVLGLASVDISTTKGSIRDWGVLGLASLDGRVGVFSSYRCHRRAKSAAQAAHRLGKTAVHELGHTFGLEHCPNSGCLMEDGKGSVFTTDGEYDLCESCRGKLAARGLLSSPRLPPPWPKPTPG